VSRSRASKAHAAVVALLLAGLAGGAPADSAVPPKFSGSVAGGCPVKGTTEAYIAALARGDFGALRALGIHDLPRATRYWGTLRSWRGDIREARLLTCQEEVAFDGTASYRPVYRLYFDGEPVEVKFLVTRLETTPTPILRSESAYTVLTPEETKGKRARSFKHSGNFGSWTPDYEVLLKQFHDRATSGDPSLAELFTEEFRAAEWTEWQRQWKQAEETYGSLWNWSRKGGTSRKTSEGTRILEIPVEAHRSKVKTIERFELVRDLATGTTRIRSHRTEPASGDPGVADRSPERESRTSAPAKRAPAPTADDPIIRCEKEGRLSFKRRSQCR
jgi:hypothetical protein